MSTCSNCGKVMGLHSSILQGCMCQYSMQAPPQRKWVGLTQTQVKLLWEGVQEEAVKSGDSLNWVFYTHINEALKEKNNAPKRI